MAALSALDKWKAQLRADGKAALRALLNGTASLGRLSAAAPEDAMDAILGAEAGDSGLVHAFDGGCAALIEEFRSTLLQQEGRAFRIELAKLTTLVMIIRRLLPEQTVVGFHRHYILWSGFFENFVVDRGLDLRREYFRTLALSQGVAAEHNLEPRRQDVGIHPDERSLGHTVFSAEPVPKDEWQRVLAFVARPLLSMRSQVETIMQKQQRYADVSGGVFCLVRRACNFGMRLLEEGPTEEKMERGRFARSLAKLAFKYDPVNVRAWSLMRDALAAAGRITDAELVGWEAIRRFPEDLQWRTQLARVLAVHSGWPGRNRKPAQPEGCYSRRRWSGGRAQASQ